MFVSSHQLTLPNSKLSLIQIHNPFDLLKKCHLYWWTVMDMQRKACCLVFFFLTLKWSIALNRFASLSCTLLNDVEGHWMQENLKLTHCSYCQCRSCPSLIRSVSLSLSILHFQWWLSDVLCSFTCACMMKRTASCNLSSCAGYLGKALTKTLVNMSETTGHLHPQCSSLSPTKWILCMLPVVFPISCVTIKQPQSSLR